MYVYLWFSWDGGRRKFRQFELTSRGKWFSAFHDFLLYFHRFSKPINKNGRKICQLRGRMLALMTLGSEICPSGDLLNIWLIEDVKGDVIRIQKCWRFRHSFEFSWRTKSIRKRFLLLIIHTHQQKVFYFHSLNFHKMNKTWNLWRRRFFGNLWMRILLLVLIIAFEDLRDTLQEAFALADRWILLGNSNSGRLWCRIVAQFAFQLDLLLLDLLLVWLGRRSLIDQNTARHLTQSTWRRL